MRPFAALAFLALATISGCVERTSEQPRMTTDLEDSVFVGSTRRGPQTRSEELVGQPEEKLLFSEEEERLFIEVAEAGGAVWIQPSGIRVSFGYMAPNLDGRYENEIRVISRPGTVNQLKEDTIQLLEKLPRLRKVDLAQIQVEYAQVVALQQRLKCVIVYVDQDGKRWGVASRRPTFQELTSAQPD